MRSCLYGGHLSSLSFAAGSHCTSRKRPRCGYHIHEAAPPLSRARVRSSTGHCKERTRGPPAVTIRHFTPCQLDRNSSGDSDIGRRQRRRDKPLSVEFGWLGLNVGRRKSSRRASWTAAPPTRQPLSPLSQRSPFPCAYSQPCLAVPAGKPSPPLCLSSLPFADPCRDTRGTTGTLSPLSHMRFHARDFTCYSRASHGMPAGRCTGQFGQRKLVVNPKLVTAMQVRENEDEMEMRVVEHAGLLLPVSRVRR